MGIAEEKAALRKEIRRLQREQDAALRRQSDEALRKQLFDLPEWQQAAGVFVFVSAGVEPDTMPILQRALAEGKCLSVPLCTGEGTMIAAQIRSLDQLRPGKYGILEPDWESLDQTCGGAEIDLALVPGLCYDRAGYRLGQGGGYYDRWLAGHRVCTVGICRKSFLQESLPREAHDLPVHMLLTEDAVLRCR